VANFEMESSTLFTLASLAGLRAGTVCAVYANRPAGTFISPDAKPAAEARAIEVGLETIDFLARMDEAAGGGRFHLADPSRVAPFAGPA
jgi:uridine phosphorylase